MPKMNKRSPYTVKYRPRAEVDPGTPIFGSPPESKGFGDTVAKATRAMGIKPCGKCKKRQEALNKMFPYKNGDNPNEQRNKTDPPVNGQETD